MEEQQSARILFVINPISGGADKQLLLEIIEKRSVEDRFVSDIYYTTGDQDKEKLTEAIRKYRPSIVAAVGGDGTCNMVASVLINCPGVTLGIIPFGSANGLAREFNIPLNKEQAVQLLTTGQVKAIDVVQVNDNCISLHISDLGLNARIVRRFEQEKSRGMWSYFRQFFRELAYAVPSRFTITSEDLQMRPKAVMVAFANSSRYGTGAILNPMGKIDDGKFELCIIKPFPYSAMLSMLIQFFRGTIERSSYVDIISCKHAVITTKKKLMLQVDGEYMGKVKRVEVRIKPNAVKVVLPLPDFQNANSKK